MTATTSSLDNTLVTQSLREMANLLEAQDDNPYRVAAYRHAAHTVETMSTSLREIYDTQGEAGLDALEGVGEHIAAAMAELLKTGHWEELEHQRAAHPNAELEEASAPPIEMLLDVDQEYRAGAASGKLPKIAPHQFNPDGSAWLPVLHTERPGWHVTALYSNTARAHQLGRTHDWVMLFAKDAKHHEFQYTVVTASHGPLTGRRAVRGHEAQCLRWYEQQRH